MSAAQRNQEAVLMSARAHLADLDYAKDVLGVRFSPMSLAYIADLRARVIGGSTGGAESSGSALERCVARPPTSSGSTGREG